MVLSSCGWLWVVLGGGGCFGLVLVVACFITNKSFFLELREQKVKYFASLNAGSPSFAFDGVHFQGKFKHVSH